MMNKLKFISITFLMIISILFILPNYSNAEDTSETTTEIIDSGKRFLESADQKPMFDENVGKKAIDSVYYIALGIGVIVAVVVGMILGIQFITSGVEGQAKVKEKLIPFGIGAFVVFGAFGIWRLALNIAQSTFG